jgi:hypothetical protein
MPCQFVFAKRNECESRSQAWRGLFFSVQIVGSGAFWTDLARALRVHMATALQALPVLVSSWHHFPNASAISLVCGRSCMCVSLRECDIPMSRTLNQYPHIQPRE